MKKILLPIVLTASTVFGVASLASAGGGGSATGVRAPTETTVLIGSNGLPVYPVAQLPPVVSVAPQTVPPVTPLPVTGSDSSSTLAIGAVALGVGGGLVLVARSRRRRPAQPAV